MGLYARYVLPHLLDYAMRDKCIMRQRGKIVPLAHGRVLEVGIGSGLNLSFYDKSRLQKLIGLDPSPELGRIARRRAQETGLDVEWLPLSGEKIPLEDASVDSIVITYTMCTIPDVHSALLEMRRVLRSGGQMFFCEHGRAPDESVRKWQDRLNPLWGRISGGCRLNRDVPRIVQDAGFHVASLETMYLPGPRPMTFNYWGTATR
ncbi:MAG TPA: class I SAM-dependent methyltransferase [Candidatus Limnocylindrales bacterium]|nr:class I SAM-dependent methyltransferase [Candidatus Limnocylindrales bacterium]